MLSIYRLRYRIHLKLTSQSGINEAALRYQLLQLPGIQDVVFVTSAGSFMVYLLPFLRWCLRRFCRSGQGIVKSLKAGASLLRGI